MMSGHDHPLAGGFDPGRTADRAETFRVGAGALSRWLPQFPGKARIFAACDRRLRAWARRRGALEVDVAGVTFVLDTSDLHDFRVMYGLDTALADYLVRHIGNRNIVLWDVGANVGAVTLTVAARCPRVRVVAIEPSPAVGRRLERNLAANPRLAARIQVLPVALAAETGEAAFYESAESFNGGVGRLGPAGNTSSEPCRVPVWAGDDLIAKGLAPAPDVLKIDVEGFEEPAVRGLDRHLARLPVHVVFEHEPYRLASSDNPPSPVPFLRQRGYAIRELRGVAAGPVVESLPSRHADLIACR